MPRETFNCYYNEKTKLYRKRIKDAAGKYIDLYDRDKNALKKKYEQAKSDIKVNLQINDNITVAEYAVRWYQLNTANLSFSRKTDYKSAINKHIAPRIGNMKIRDVEVDDIKSLMLDMKDLAYSTQIKTVTTLKKIFASAEENHLILKSPCLSLKAGGYKSKEKKPLNDTQIEILIEAVKETSAYPFVMLGLYTGMRREEILGLQWDCVHLDDIPYVSVQRKLTFNNCRPVISTDLKSKAAQRDIPIPSILVEYLKNIKRKSDFVICNSKGEEYSYTSFRNMWQIVERRKTKDEKAGSFSKHSPQVKRTIDFDVSPHILRHTYITKLILSGMNIKKVQYLAGHANVQMTLDIYTKLLENKPEDLINDVKKVFQGKNEGKN